MQLTDRDKEMRAASGASNCLHNNIGQHSDVALVDGQVTPVMIETVVRTYASFERLHALEKWWEGYSHHGGKGLTLSIIILKLRPFPFHFTISITRPWDLTWGMEIPWKITWRNTTFNTSAGTYVVRAVCAIFLVLQEVAGGCRRLQEVAGDCRRLHRLVHYVYSHRIWIIYSFDYPSNGVTWSHA